MQGSDVRQDMLGNEGNKEKTVLDEVPVFRNIHKTT
jgi:hypothetical protein